MRTVSMPGIVRAALLVAIAVTWTWVSASASIARAMSLDELTAKSASIVVATCRSTRSHWTADRSRIVTEAVYETVDVVKGDAGAEFTVESLGGVADGLGMYVPGMPTFQAGRKEVLFLTPSQDDGWWCVGMSQGQFVVSRSKAAVEIVGRNLNGLEVIGQRDERLRTQNLDSFLDKVRAAAR